MKKLKYTLAAILSITLTLSSCDSAEKKETKVEKKQSSINIPEWENRKSNVGDINEISKMYETYLSISDQIKANPKDYAARLKMADLFIVEARATGNYNHYYPAAVSMIDGVLEENPSNKDDLFRAYTSKAVILLSLHKFVEAKEMGEKALLLNPNNSRVYGILTDANLELGNYDKAVEMADSMVAKRPDLRSYSRVSYLREVYGDVEGAKEAMELAVKAGYPGHEETSWAQVTLGNLYESYGDLNSAEQLYQLALQERKNYPFAISGLASVEMKRENYDSSLAKINRAIELRPEPAFYEDLAQINYQKGDEAAFKASKEKAFAMLKGLSGEEKNHGHSHNEDHDDHHHDKGDSHSHDTEQSEHGHSHETGLEMANLYLKFTDENDEALHNALHEYSIRPNNIEVNTALAKAYYNTEKYKLALEHFNKAMITNSKNPDLLLTGGLIHMKTGNPEKGKMLIEESMKLNPYQKSDYVTQAKAMKKSA